MESLNAKNFCSNRKILVKKIEQVVKLGFLPKRGNEKYYYRFVNERNEYISDYINCFAHAFFNFSNQEIKDLFVENGEIKKELLDEFWYFSIDEHDVEGSLEKLVTGLVRDSGLKASKCKDSTECANNQWKVGVYYREGTGESSDFHFLKWEDDEYCWSSKNGNETRVDKFYELPYVYRKDYKLIDVYMVTNEFAKDKFVEKEREL